MPRHQTVKELGDAAECGDMFISPDNPATTPSNRQRPKDCIGTTVNGAIVGDEMDRLGHTVGRQLGESFGNRGVLIRNVFDGLPSKVAPARNPAAAEVAITIEEDDRLCRRRRYFDGVTHWGDI